MPVWNPAYSWYFFRRTEQLPSIWHTGLNLFRETSHVSSRRRTRNRIFIKPGIKHLMKTASETRGAPISSLTACLLLLNFRRYPYFSESVPKPWYVWIEKPLQFQWWPKLEMRLRRLQLPILLILTYIQYISGSKPGTRSVLTIAVATPLAGNCQLLKAIAINEWKMYYRRN